MPFFAGHIYAVLNNGAGTKSKGQGGEKSRERKKEKKERWSFGSSRSSVWDSPTRMSLGNDPDCESRIRVHPGVCGRSTISLSKPA